MLARGSTIQVYRKEGAIIFRDLFCIVFPNEHLFIISFI